MSSETFFVSGVRVELQQAMRYSLRKRKLRPRRTVSKSCELCTMPSCGMWGRVDLVRTDISEEFVASILRVEVIHEGGAALTVA